jgi:hypothetical protein
MLRTDHALDHLAAAIAQDGFTTATECEISLVVDRARRLGLDCPAVDVLADLTAPAIVRARAFGIVAIALSRQPAPVSMPTFT